MKLSDGEKLIILMLADIYKAMKIKGEFDPAFIEATIHGGHLWGFNWEYTGIPFEPFENPREVKETTNVLDMWVFLEDAYDKLTDDDKARLEREAGPIGKSLRFHGFDGNNEAHYHIATYMVDDMYHRFQHFKGRDLNSHSPSIDRYLRMYRVFEPLRAKLHSRSLNADELISILNA
jgi:uncharacterized protein YfbU (UPF0304 family)